VKAPPEVKRALERLVARLKRKGYLDEDYEVPWKREEKAEDDVLKSLAAMVMEMREEIRKFMGVRVEKAEDAIKEENKSEKNEAQASANTESVTVKVESPKAQVSGVEPRPKAEEWALEEARRVIRRIFEQY
jgi:phenylalanyl-tRNA synthetase alpha subunit